MPMGENNHFIEANKRKWPHQFNPVTLGVGILDMFGKSCRGKMGERQSIGDAICESPDEKTGQNIRKSLEKNRQHFPLCLHAFLVQYKSDMVI